ncbi:MAG: BatD family protein [Halarcobacter sp.]
MKNIRLILILIFLNISLFANVTLHSPNTFTKGESFIFEYTAVGSSVKFPKIKEIDGFIVESLGTSRSLQVLNGNYSEKISKKYRIVANNEFTIPSFTFIVNDEEVKTNPKKITEQKISKTKSDNFELTLSPSKTSLYVGEELLIKLIFKYKKDIQITNLGFEQPHFENFWHKKVDNSNKRYEQNDYIIQELDFLLFPQKSGKLKISPLRVDVQIMDSSSSAFGFFTASPKLLKIYSNKLEFDIKELPQGISLIGDFNIKAKVDKTKIKQGESVSFKIDIEGRGNFDDIEDIKLNIPKATIYDNKPEVNTKYSNNGYEGKYSKAYSIVSSSSFLIPSITLKYFDKKEKRIVEKTTESFKIEVENQVLKELILEKPKEKTLDRKELSVKVQQSTLTQKIVYFFFGVLTTILIIGLVSYAKLQKSKKKKDDLPLIKIVKKTKDKNSLMKALLPYLKIDESLDELIYKCESEIDFKVLKKQTIDLLKQIKI